MNAVEALMVQRDAVMFGWERSPSGPNTACAVVRRDAIGKSRNIHQDNELAENILWDTSIDFHGMTPIGFNYDPSTTLADMLDLFDAAIRRAKELECAD